MVGLTEQSEGFFFLLNKLRRVEIVVLKHVMNYSGRVQYPLGMLLVSDLLYPQSMLVAVIYICSVFYV